MNIIKKISNNSFFKSLSILASGSIIAQIINILASPITTRLFTPEELGAYTLIMTAVSIFGPIINLRYDLSIVMESSEDNVYALVKSSLILSIILTSIITIGYALYYFFTSNTENFILNLLVIFILLNLNGIINVFNSYNNRLKEYGIITTVYVQRTVGQVITMIITGFFKMGYIGLVVSQIFGQILGLKKQYSSLKKSINRIINTNYNQMKKVLLLHKRQLITVPSTFLNNLSYSSINIFISSLFGNSILGYYSMSYRMLGLPLTIIANNVSRIYFEEASREYEKTNGYHIAFKKTFSFLLVISIFMCIFLLLFAPQLFSFFFGSNWKEAGIYVQILAPMFSIRLISTAVGPALLIVKKQNIDLILQIFLISISIFDFVLCQILTFSVKEFLIIFSFFGSIVYLFSIIIAYKYSKPFKKFMIKKGN